MASMKAKKGNPFEYDVVYNLNKIGYDAIRIDDNSKGLDIVVKKDNYIEYLIECKNRQGLSWNKLVKIYTKLEETKFKNNLAGNPLVVFKSNRQPVLIFSKTVRGYTIIPFNEYFLTVFEKRPKGYKPYKEKK